MNKQQMPTDAGQAQTKVHQRTDAHWASLSHTCTKRNVIRRMGCLLIGHFKIKNKCQKCGEQFGVPKMDCPPEPP